MDRSLAQVGQGAAMRGPHPGRGPSGHWAAIVAPCARGLKACRQMHLHPPRLAAAPAVAAQVFPGRGQGIAGIVAPDIAPPIAREIDRVFLEHGRHELGVAHRARP